MQSCSGKIVVMGHLASTLENSLSSRQGSDQLICCNYRAVFEARSIEYCICRLLLLEVVSRAENTFLDVLFIHSSLSLEGFVVKLRHITHARLLDAQT